MGDGGMGTASGGGTGPYASDTDGSGAELLHVGSECADGGGSAIGGGCFVLFAGGVGLW